MDEDSKNYDVRKRCQEIKISNNYRPLTCLLIMRDIVKIQITKEINHWLKSLRPFRKH